MSQGEILDKGFTADTSGLPEQYLDFQGKQFGATFDVLILCNLIFHIDRVLLFRMKDDVKSWKDKYGVPLYRLYRNSEDDNDIAVMLRSRIDRKMAEDVSVEEFGRVACRTQAGLDVVLKYSSAATALHTAVSPSAIEDSIWLRASLMWRTDEQVQVKPDDYVCQDIIWATEDEVSKIASENFIMGLKEDIETAFSLRRRSSLT